MRGFFFETVRKKIGNTCIKKHGFLAELGLGGSVWDMGVCVVKNDRTGSGKAMETLPVPKTAMTNAKIQNLSKKKNPEFDIFPGKGPLFPWGRAPYFSG